MLVNAQHDGRGERLEYGDCVNYFNGANDNETDENGNVLDEVEEFIHMMEAEMHHSQHIDPTAHFLQDHINFWTHADRWSFKTDGNDCTTKKNTYNINEQ